MERKISCTILTPDGHVYNGDIDFAVVPAFKGGMGFLYNHAPLIAQLTTGEVRLLNGNETEYLVVEGGFVEIENNKLSIFPLKATKKSDLFKEDIEKEIKRLGELKKPVDLTESEKIIKEINKQKIKLKVANR
jgi:F-type H+-transporting ATPase subunit epsilon